MQMKKITIAILLSGCFSPLVHALEQLPDAALDAVQGQAGADLSLNLQLNHTRVDPTATPSTTLLRQFDPAFMPQFDKNLCQNGTGTGATFEYCRLAIALNNRTVDNSGNPLGNNTGNKQWVVLKGIQGSIYIPRLGLDGADVEVNGAYKPALMLSFSSSDVNKKPQPIQIRNLGFQSISMETSTSADAGIGATEAQKNVAYANAGYLKSEQYSSATHGLFDGANPLTGVGREKGFLGVNMNTNLLLTGNIKIFSCSATGSVAHPRC